jgi:putative hemolysin
MPMLTANVVTPLNERGGYNPENSSGEAATFPKALDTTNKEESFCMQCGAICVGSQRVQNGRVGACSHRHSAE